MRFTSGQLRLTTADVEQGAFRRDLYHRINTFRITLPPLREHRADIPELVAHFLALGGEPPFEMSREALAVLARYHFPGNVRELERIVERAQVLCDGPVILPEHLGELEARTADGAPDRVGAVADELYVRIVEQGEPFWDLVQKPYLKRALPAVEVRRLVQRTWAESGTYREMARRFHLEDRKQYRKLLDFLRNHHLLPGASSSR